ncbi:LacI family DNA-binding transcriptional regulator [Oceanobacillus longus]|uniref:LacI family DNA-binding transcriptional regulator n=1 Tax=Oceanobacillus longus TaxID=930120 RepID=A0ABV8GR29_9BACI
MAKMEDVAKVAGVSKSTVSNVFSEKRPISKEVKERVLRIANELNYKPNYWARSLAVKETRIIGLNMQAEKVKFSQFHLSLLNGVLNECYKQGYRLLVNTLSDNYKNKVEFQTSDPVDGEILLDPEIEDPRIVGRMKQNIPLVVIGKPPQTYEDKLSYVDNNNVSAAEGIGKHLISLGHKDILFLNAPSFRTVSMDRELGFKISLKEAGIELDSDQVVYKDKKSSSVEFGYEKAKEILIQNNKITAIITDNDKMALGVYRAAEEEGYSIPNDLAVISFSDDSVYATEFSPPLSCVHLNGEQLGSESAKLLIDQLHTNKPLVKRIIVPTHFEKRGSCSNS